VVSKPFVIKRSSDFEEIRLKGKRIFPCRWLTIGALKKTNEPLKIGWTISSKVGSSVIRNKLKRWCRVYLRQEDLNIKSGYYINIIFRPTNNDFYKNLQYSDLKNQLDKVFSKEIKFLV
jgi:ribonuclease P protein component